MGLAASRLTALKTCSGPTRSSSSIGGTTTTMIRRLEEWRCTIHSLCGGAEAFRKGSVSRRSLGEGGCRVSTDLWRKSTSHFLVRFPCHERNTAAVHGAHSWLSRRKTPARRAGRNREDARAPD